MEDSDDPAVDESRLSQVGEDGAMVIEEEEETPDIQANSSNAVTVPTAENPNAMLTSHPSQVTATTKGQTSDPAVANGEETDVSIHLRNSLSNITIDDSKKKKTRVQGKRKDATIKQASNIQKDLLTINEGMNTQKATLKETSEEMSRTMKIAEDMNIKLAAIWKTVDRYHALSTEVGKSAIITSQKVQVAEALKREEKLKMRVERLEKDLQDREEELKEANRNLESKAKEAATLSKKWRVAENEAKAEKKKLETQITNLEKEIEDQRKLHETEIQNQKKNEEEHNEKAQEQIEKVRARYKEERETRRKLEAELKDKEAEIERLKTIALTSGNDEKTDAPMETDEREEEVEQIPTKSRYVSTGDVPVIEIRQEDIAFEDDDVEMKEDRPYRQVIVKEEKKKEKDATKRKRETGQARNEGGEKTGKKQKNENGNKENEVEKAEKSADRTKREPYYQVGDRNAEVIRPGYVFPERLVHKRKAATYNACSKVYEKAEDGSIKGSITWVGEENFKRVKRVNGKEIETERKAVQKAGRSLIQLVSKKTKKDGFALIVAPAMDSRANEEMKKIARDHVASLLTYASETDNVKIVQPLEIHHQGQVHKTFVNKKSDWQYNSRGYGVALCYIQEMIQRIHPTMYRHKELFNRDVMRNAPIIEVTENMDFRNSMLKLKSFNCEQWK